MEKRFKKGLAVRNIIHSSANTEEAQKEIKFFFSAEEIKKT
jgi:nucleoside diphosphate kinase